MDIYYKEFLGYVSEHTGLSSLEEAESTAKVVLKVLGEALEEYDRSVVARALPDPLSTALTQSQPGQELTIERFYHRIGEHEQISDGFAMEHAQTVCWELRRLLKEDALHFLQKRLPADIAELFSDEHAREPGISSVHHTPAVPPGAGHHLSDGRPGSMNPVSEGRPPEKAHTESVARSANPHGDRKVSSSHGANEGHSLSTGKPRSDRPISEDKGK